MTTDNSSLPVGVCIACGRAYDRPPKPKPAPAEPTPPPLVREAQLPPLAAFCIGVFSGSAATVIIGVLAFYIRGAQ